MGAPKALSDEFGVEDVVPTLVEDEEEQLFGRYRLLYQLAFGGMATVYLGRAIGPGGFDRPVAIKRIHPHLAKQRSFVEMFLDEARIVSHISHPNVCSVYDFGEIDGTYYMTMEYLVGESLASLLKTVAGRPDALHSRRWRALALRLIADACEGLHAAHELKDDHGRPLDVVHRDVSPANLFVTYDGAIKVVDFGVAFAQGRLHETATGAIKGKLAYMPPEQFAGEPADRRYDIWALGVCLWEMLTGRRLFRRSNEVETMMAVRSGEIPGPSVVDPTIDAAIDSLVLKALEREPGSRYTSAREFGQALQTYLASCGERASLADLAEWMAELFNERRTRQFDLIEAVHQSAVRRDRAIHFQATAINHVPASTRVERWDDEPSEGAESETVSVARPVDSPAAPVGRDKHPRWIWLVLLLGLLGGFAFTIALVVGSSGDDSEEGVVSLPDTPRAAPPIVRSEPEPARVPMPPSPVAPSPEPAPPPEPAPAEPPPPAGDEERAPRARRRRARAPTGTGTVTIVTQGAWADVYRGRSRLGRTPGRFTLPAGRHVLRLLPRGEEPARRVTVRVQPGSNVRRVVSMR